MEELQAEGIPCTRAHNDPLYRHPAFTEIDRFHLHGKEIDYSRVRCPEAERIYAPEAITPKKDFLMDRENVDLVLEALRKLRGNVDEL